MSTTEKKPRVKKPPAEIVGSFEDVMRREKCEDGRDLFVFRDSGDFDGNHRSESFILAVSELLAWRAIHSELGHMEKMTRSKVEERQREELLKLMEERNGETEEAQPASEV